MSRGNQDPRAYGWILHAAASAYVNKVLAQESCQAWKPVVKPFECEADLSGVTLAVASLDATNVLTLLRTMCEAHVALKPANAVYRVVTTKNEEKTIISLLPYPMKRSLARSLPGELAPVYVGVVAFALKQSKFEDLYSSLKTLYGQYQQALMAESESGDKLSVVSIDSSPPQSSVVQLALVEIPAEDNDDSDVSVTDIEFSENEAEEDDDGPMEIPIQ